MHDRGKDRFGGMFTMGEESIRVLIVDDEFIMR